MAVRVEGGGPVRTVVLDRPDVRDAVDRATAETPVSAFRGIDEDASVLAADEALSWGLADRVVGPGEAGAAAEELAASLAALPQPCLRSDRAWLYEGAGRPLREAMAVEFAHGVQTLAAGDVVPAVARFATGEGRHGAVQPPPWA